MRGRALAFLVGVALASRLDAADAARVESPAAASSSPPHRIALLIAGEPDYVALAVPPQIRRHAEAESRLVVISGGVPSIDFGLRDERRAAPSDGGVPMEEGVRDDAELSADDRSAVILTTRFRRPALGWRENPGEAPPAVSGSTEITWIDAARPASAFTLSLPEDRWVKEVVAVSGGRGLAVSTTSSRDAPADLKIYGPNGRVRAAVSELEAGVADLTVTNDGTAVAADLLFPEREGLPDRGVRVFDLDGGSSWTYTWHYGAADEPSSWRLQEGGRLELKLPGSTIIYDRSGTPVGGEARKRRSRR